MSYDRPPVGSSLRYVHIPPHELELRLNRVAELLVPRFERDRRAPFPRDQT
jgi:hypothetical protein